MVRTEHQSLLLFCTLLCRIRYPIRELILECKEDAHLAVKSIEREKGSQVQDLIGPLPTGIFFSFCGGGSVSLEVVFRTWSGTGLGQILAVLFWMWFSPCYLFLLESCGLGFLRERTSLERPRTTNQNSLKLCLKHPGHFLWLWHTCRLVSSLPELVGVKEAFWCISLTFNIAKGYVEMAFSYCNQLGLSFTLLFFFPLLF